MIDELAETLSMLEEGVVKERSATLRPLKPEKAPAHQPPKVVRIVTAPKQVVVYKKQTSTSVAKTKTRMVVKPKHLSTAVAQPAADDEDSDKGDAEFRLSDESDDEDGNDSDFELEVETSAKRRINQRAVRNKSKSDVSSVEGKKVGKDKLPKAHARQLAEQNVLDAPKTGRYLPKPAI